MSSDRKKANARGRAILRAFTQACLIVATILAIGLGGTLLLAAIIGTFHVHFLLGCSTILVIVLVALTIAVYDSNAGLDELEDEEDEEEDWEDDDGEEGN